MPIRNPPYISQNTVTRRSVLDWLGKATVLALGADVLAACAAGSGGGDGGPGFLGDGGTGDGGADGGFSGDGASGWDADGGGDAFGDGSLDGSMDVSDAGTGEGLVFRPGPTEGGVLDGWPVRTVDRQDIESILSSWSLTIDGMVESPATLSFADLISLPRLDQVMDFHCVEGWSVLDVPWNGIHISTLLEAVGGATEGATYVNFHTIGGQYNESLPLEVALEPHSMLAYGAGGNTLPLEHGFPLRVHVPRLLAYKSAKYVERVELSDEPVIGFWVRAGYPYDAEVPESRLREGRY